MIIEREIAAHADLEAAARYRDLADRNPSLRREYLRRASDAQRIGTGKLPDAPRCNRTNRGYKRHCATCGHSRTSHDATGNCSKGCSCTAFVDKCKA